MNGTALKVLFAVLGTVLTIVGILYSTRVGKSRPPTRRTGLAEKTVGIVKSVRQEISHMGGEEHYFYIPKISYAAGGLTFESEDQASPWRRSGWEYAKEGDAVEVWYDPLRPERFVCRPPKEIWERRGGFERFLYKRMIPFYIFAGAFMLFGCAALGPDRFFALFGQTPK